jgi:peptidoglycan/LPS O-acetylase OafA/YrhL
VTEGDPALSMLASDVEMPAPVKTLELIQIFRGAAACLVVLYHVTTTNHFYGAYLGGAFRWGHAGVDFFFQLSGFIMLYVHWDQAGDFRRAPRFLIARVLRIYPIYWCVLAVTVVMLWKYPPPPQNVWAPLNSLEPRNILSSVLLLDPNHTIVGPAWTLTYEMAFYLFFTAYFVLPRALFTACALCWFGAIVAQWYGWIAWPHPILLRLIVGEFFFGMSAALLVRWWSPRRVSAWWIVASVAVWIVFARAEMTLQIDAYTWWAIPSFLLLLTGGLYDHATQRTYDRTLVLIGAASYSIYLVHYGLIVLFAETVDAYRPLASAFPEVTLTLLTAGIVVVGVVVHLWIERPLLRFLRRRLLRERASAAVERLGGGFQGAGEVADSP